MKPNTKYVHPDGTQYFMCPMTEFKITQVEGVGTHRGTKALDFASKTAGYRAPYYAPADCVCVMAFPDHGQAHWQTINPVYIANGKKTHVTWVTVHDNSFNAYVGMTLKQGEQMGNMGTKGYATGVHLHTEACARKANDSEWSANSYGIWCYPNEIYLDELWLMDDTNILTPMQGVWVKIADVYKTNSETNTGLKLIEEKGRAFFRNETPIICHRDSPTGAKFGQYVKGEYQDYTHKYIGNGHRYISWLYENDKSIRCFVAVSATEEKPKPGSEDEWATFGEYGKPKEDQGTGSDNDDAGKLDLIKQNGMAVFRNGVPLIVRKDSPTGEDTGKRKNQGDKQSFQWIYIGNGHRYIVWEENGVKLFCAVSGVEEIPEPDSENEWAKMYEHSEEIPKEDEDIIDVEQPNLRVETLDSQHGLSIVHNLVEKSLYDTKCPFIMKPEYVVVHQAGTKGNPSARNLTQSMINDAKSQKSWHFSVDEVETVEGLSLNRNGWHASDGKDGTGNRKGIAIEICRDMYDDGTGTYNSKSGLNDPRYEKAVDNGALLAAILLNKYGWDIRHLKKHQDFTDKYCPHHILNDGWDNFVQLVKNHLDKIQGKVEENNDNKPQEPDKPDNPNTDDEQKEEINNGLINKLLKLLIKLLNKILNIFK